MKVNPECFVMAVDLSALQCQISALLESNQQDLSTALSIDANAELRRSLRRLDVALKTSGQIHEEMRYRVCSEFCSNFIQTDHLLVKASGHRHDTRRNGHGHIHTSRQ